MSEKKETLTLDEALAALPEGDSVHTFLGFIGADWPRQKIVDAITASPSIGITGPVAQAMGHGIAIKHPSRESWLFVASRYRTDGGPEVLYA